MNKIALCIGNAAYPEESLKNPVNDATDFSSKLKALGFKCNVKCDAKFREMDDCLKQYSDELDKSEVGLFFFAGHGMQIYGDNYLTATDTDFNSETDAKYSSLNLNKVIEVLEKGSNSTSIIILDACRNNPYERRWRNVGSRGLAPVHTPKGMIIAFATSPGQTAYDGDKDNGAFTAALLKHLMTQKITIEDLFKRVRNTLSAITSGKQISWEHTSLMGDFYFNPAFLTDDCLAVYSQEAIADATFDCVDGRPLCNIIQKLRSRNWHQQNPAIKALYAVDFAESNKDGLFVLGRNLYQAACGEAREAENYIDNLADKLGRIDQKVTFHILNGILFEIYFDSYGRFRKRKKTAKLDEVFRLENVKNFKRSFDFIQQSLLPYQKQLFYIPGLKRDVLVDVGITPVDNKKSTVKRVVFDGQEISYTEDGETFIANTDADSQIAQNVKNFEQELAQQMATPKRRLCVTYSEEATQDLLLTVPFSYKIQRFSV